MSMVPEVQAKLVRAERNKKFLEAARRPGISKGDVLQIFWMMNDEPIEEDLEVAEELLLVGCVDADILDVVSLRWPKMAVEHPFLEAAAWSGERVFVTDEQGGVLKLRQMGLGLWLPELLERVLYKEVTEAFAEDRDAGELFGLGRAISLRREMSPELKEAWEAFLPARVEVEAEAEVEYVWFDLEARVVRCSLQRPSVFLSPGWNSTFGRKVGSRMLEVLEKNDVQHLLFGLHGLWRGNFEKGRPLFRDDRWLSLWGLIVTEMDEAPSYSSPYERANCQTLKGLRNRLLRVREGRQTLEDLAEELRLSATKERIYWRQADILEFLKGQMAAMEDELRLGRR
jgi:hypothetical protein